MYIHGHFKDYMIVPSTNPQRTILQGALEHKLHEIEILSRRKYKLEYQADVAATYMSFAMFLVQRC